MIFITQSGRLFLKNTEPLAIHQSLQERLANFQEHLKEQGTTLEALITFDSKGGAQAMNDPGLFQEILKPMRTEDGCSSSLTG